MNLIPINFALTLLKAALVALGLLSDTICEPTNAWSVSADFSLNAHLSASSRRPGQANEKTLAPIQSQPPNRSSKKPNLKTPK